MFIKVVCLCAVCVVAQMCVHVVFPPLLGCERTQSSTAYISYNGTELRLNEESKL